MSQFQETQKPRMRFFLRFQQKHLALCIFIVDWIIYAFKGLTLYF